MYIRTFLVFISLFCVSLQLRDIPVSKGKNKQALRYSMYNDHISHLVNGWWDFYKEGIILKVYQIKITHHRNFYLSLIYLAFNFTLKSMGRTHSIKIFLKEITFLHKFLGRKFHTLSLYKNMK
jgi:hypothetical protein